MCFRFQALKAIKAAAGSTIASSRVRSVRVRSVNRHFLDILILAGWSTHQYQGKTIKPCQRDCVKATQTIVKSCKRDHNNDAVLTLLDPREREPEVPGGAFQKPGWG